MSGSAGEESSECLKDQADDRSLAAQTRNSDVSIAGFSV